MKNTKKVVGKLALLGVSLMLALIGAEFVLRQVVDSGDYLIANLMDDSVLGHRVQPGGSGHDNWGYRNLEVPEEAEVVAIGDSQTYGVSAVLRESWPYQLGEILDETIYNLALGGYGPLEYLHLLESQAPRLNPHTVLIGIYLGNDLLDTARAAHQREHWADWRQNEINDPMLPADGNPGGKSKRLGWLRDTLAHQSVLYGMLRVTVGPMLHYVEGHERAMSSTPDERWIWIDPESPNVKTIFTPRLRLFALNTDNPAVNEGIVITRRVIERIGTIQNDRDWNIYIVLIPTKEYVYSDLIGVGDNVPEDFADLYKEESKVRSSLLSWLRAKDLNVIDVLLPLRAKVKAHVQIYPQNEDGHPNGEGYAAIARAIADRLAIDQATKR